MHPHFVWIAEAFAALIEAQDRGDLAVTESRLEVNVGPVRADMEVGVTLPGEQEPTYYYLEVEVYDGKDDDYIRRKLGGYIDAWDANPGGFPYVIVAAPDDDHRLQIAAIMDELDEKDADLFKVCTIDRLVETIRATATTADTVPSEPVGPAISDVVRFRPPRVGWVALPVITEGDDTGGHVLE